VEAREQAYAPVPAAKVAELVDRLAGADEGTFVLSWLESLALDAQRPLPPAIAVRLIRATREAGRLERARAERHRAAHRADRSSLHTSTRGPM